MGSSWQSVWERKGTDCRSYTLEGLIAADGFDLGGGKFSADSWSSHVLTITERLGLCPGQKVLEVGCGAGAFLFPLRDRGISLYGIDYAESMVRIARKAIPEGRFECAEAENLPFPDDYFDLVLSHSVINYFPQDAYAERVILEMARVLKSGGAAAILDINDAAKREDFTAKRIAFLGAAEYERRYRECPQLFFSKAWFQRVADSHGMACEVFDQDILGYENSHYRFNAVLRLAMGSKPQSDIPNREGMNP